jgi:hypothetical protein
MRGSQESTRRTLRPTPQRLDRLDLEILLAEFRNLNISEDSEFLIPVTPERTRHFGFLSPTSTELTSTSPLFQPDILSPIHLLDRILDSPISTSVAVPSQATVSGTPDDFLDYSGFTSPLVPDAFHHLSPRPDPYLPERSSRSRSLSPLTPLPWPFAADIEVPSAHLPAFSALSALSASHFRSLSTSTSSSSTSSDSSPSLSFLFGPSFHSSVVLPSSSSTQVPVFPPISRSVNNNLVRPLVAPMANPIQMPL